MEGELVYDMGVESLFRGIGDRLTPQLKETVRGLGIDLDKKLLPAYPKEVWVQVVDAVARSVSPELELARARRELGHAISRGFKDSVMGRLIAPGLRLMGVRRIMMRLPKNLTISNNFMVVKVMESGARGIRLEVNEAVPSEEFLCGVIEEIADYAGAKSTEINVTHEAGRVVFSVNWVE